MPELLFISGLTTIAGLSIPVRGHRRGLPLPPLLLVPADPAGVDPPEGGSARQVDVADHHGAESRGARLVGPPSGVPVPSRFPGRCLQERGQRQLLGDGRRCRDQRAFATIRDAVVTRQATDPAAHALDDLVAEVGAPGVERFVAGQQLGLIAGEVLEEVLACPGRR